MDDANRAAVAGIVADRPRQTLAAAADAALMGEHWEALLDLVRSMPAAKQNEFVAIVETFGELDPALAIRIAGRAAEHGFGERFAAAATAPAEAAS